MSGRGRRRSGGQASRLFAIVSSIAALALAAPAWRDAIDRVTAPSRYAISGRARLPVDRYVAAAHAALPAGERVGGLALTGGGPVIVSAEPAARPQATRTEVFLDPPTARVLGIARRDLGWFDDRGSSAPPLDRPAQRAGAVIARAAPYAKGIPRAVSWPTDRNPDWTVTFAGDDAVKVADDSGTARPARVRARTRLPSWPASLRDLADRSAAWCVAILVASVVPLALTTFVFLRAEPRKR